MGNFVQFINRATQETVARGHTPDFPIADWIHLPDMSAVAGQPKKYWKVSGNSVLLMDTTEQAAVDAAEAQAVLDAAEAEKDNLSANLDRVLRAVVRALNDGSFIPGSNYTGPQLKTIIRSKL